MGALTALYSLLSEFYIQLWAARYRTYKLWYQSNSLHVHSVYCGSGGERLSLSGIPAPCHLIDVRHQRQLCRSDWYSAWRQSVGDGATLLNDDGTDPVTARYHCVRYRTNGKSFLRRPMSAIWVQQRWRNSILLPDWTRLSQIVRRPHVRRQIQSAAQRGTVSNIT